MKEITFLRKLVNEKHDVIEVPVLIPTKNAPLRFFANALRFFNQSNRTSLLYYSGAKPKEAKPGDGWLIIDGDYWVMYGLTDAGLWKNLMSIKETQILTMR